MDPVNIRLLSQQLAAPQFDAPAAVVSHFCAMQAQEYRLMRWAVAMRTRRPSAAAFRDAYNSGSIIRMHLLRGTWQLVSGEDYWWMQEHLCGSAERVIRGWMSANRIVIPEEERIQILEILLNATSKLGSATKEDYVKALAEEGIVMDDHRLSYHIRFAELSGHLCSGDLLPMKATYSIAESKIGPRPTGIPTREESLKLLARKYFQSHSPATFEDFVWWTGLGVGDCRRAITLLGDELRQETWRGCPDAPLRDYEFYIHNSCRTRGVRSGNTLLLPSYDEYLIGYKSREITLPQAFRAKAHNNSGNFSPVVAQDGIICGNWSPFTASTASDSLTLFPNAPATLDATKSWHSYQSYLSR